jgi:hypothetical protein
MRMQSELPASHAALTAPGSLPQVTAHLVKRVSMLAQPLLPLSKDPAAVLNVLRCPPRGSLQGKATLCQK